MRPYSAELRGEVLAACDAGMGTREVATKFKVSESWVRRIKQDRRELNKVAPCLTRKRTPKWKAEEEAIHRAIASQPDMTLEELKAAIGTKLSVMTLCRALRKMKLTLKKKS